jgi:hypothetical protein
VKPPCMISPDVISPLRCDSPPSICPHRFHTYGRGWARTFSSSIIRSLSFFMYLAGFKWSAFMDSTSSHKYFSSCECETTPERGEGAQQCDR